MKHLNKHLIFLLVAALLFGTALTACGGEDPTPTPRISNDEDEEEDPQEDPTEEPEPTEEPTAEPEPTETPEPTATADPTAGFEDFSNEVLGVDLSYPGDWAIEFDELGSELRLASSQDIIEDSDDNIEGAIFNMLFLDSAQFAELDAEVDTTDPVQVLGVFVDFFAQPSDDGISLTVTQEPTAVTINGQSAAEVLADATDAEGDTAVMKILIVMADTRAAVVLAGAETSVEAEMRPLLDAITESIVLSAPVGGPEVPTGDVPTSLGFLLYGDTMSGTVDETGPAVWDFIGLEGESVDIFVEPEGDFDLMVDVLNESGVSILPNGEVDASFGTEEILELVIPASGQYFITIRGFADATGNYTLTLVESGGLSSLPPATSGEGTPIAYGDLVSGAVDGANPIASYSFSGAADDVVGAVITPMGDFDLIVDMVDASGNFLLSNERDAAFGVENILATLPADGVYTIQVYGFDGASGSFDLQLSYPLTNVVYAAPDTLEADDEGEGHAFPFRPLQAGDMVGIMAIPEEGLDIAIQVRQGDTLLGEEIGIDNSLDQNDAQRGFDFSVETEEFVMLVPDTVWYTFQVLNSEDEEFGGNTGDYEVVLYGSTEVVFELAFGDFVDARTNSEGLIDYVISGTPGESMVVNVIPDDDSVDMVIEILDLDLNVLATIDDGFSGEPEQLIYTFETEDLVIIRVSDFFSGEGDFLMTVDAQ